MDVAISAMLWIWLALEVGLVVRDRRRGMGGPARDRGTRMLTAVMTTAAVMIGNGVALAVQHHTATWLPGWRTSEWHVYTGVALMWIGLVVRFWAVAVLGRSFRTTVEVDAGQTVVDRGPYHWVRHPSYAGVLLIVVGYGIVLDNWISLAVMILLPLAALLRRISVEEEALVKILGASYRAYQARTKRLLPGIW